MDTKELIKKCIEKDHSAWNEFVRCYESLIIRSVRYKLNSLNADMARDQFRDIVQEIFLAIWEENKLSRIRDIRCLRKWLIMIAMNTASNYCRKRMFKDAKKTFSLDQSLSAETPGLKLDSIIPCNRFNAGKAAETGEMREAIERELNKLGHKQQIALKLNIYDCKKQKDIACIMNIPENTVATLISRAKNQVREGIEKYFERKSEK